MFHEIMSKINLDAERGIQGSSSTSQLFPKCMHRNSSCVTEASFLQNEFLAKDLYRSNIKLRIYFYVLLVANIFLLVAISVLVYISFSRNLTQHDMNKNNTRLLEAKENIPIGKKAERLFKTKISKELTEDVNCAALRYKLNASDVDPEGSCSFEDLIDALIKFVKPTEYRDVIHLIGGIPEEERNEHLEYTVSEWTRDKNTDSSVVYNATNSSIIIPSDGYYFLYCRLTFTSDVTRTGSRQTAIKHSIRIKPANQGFQKFVTVTSTTSTDMNTHSLIQRVAKFRKGEELKVTVSRAGKVHYDISDASENYIGMFKL
ncbi:uncharacterized protein LOC133181227 [Saccostrea echinata]|uniref:uncharacterized protein LOC133181227 n=1 Tax=Saccostrea echinata TaxID=191078 RepID=UPI002A805ADA|nr:uncharacterized protein LOC133181227 [Saccostrea echinata]